MYQKDLHSFFLLVRVSYFLSSILLFSFVRPSFIPYYICHFEERIAICLFDFQLSFLRTTFVYAVWARVARKNEWPSASLVGWKKNRLQYARLQFVFISLLFGIDWSFLFSIMISIVNFMRIFKFQFL